jgi:hypothetical protein
VLVGRATARAHVSRVTRRQHGEVSLTDIAESEATTSVVSLTQPWVVPIWDCRQQKSESVVFHSTQVLSAQKGSASIAAPQSAPTHEY